MAKGHRLNTSIVLAAVHGLSGLLRAVSAVEPSLSPLHPPPSPPVPNKPPRFCERKAIWSRQPHQIENVVYPINWEIKMQPSFHLEAPSDQRHQQHPSSRMTAGSLLLYPNNARQQMDVVIVNGQYWTLSSVARGLYHDRDPSSVYICIYTRCIRIFNKSHRSIYRCFDKSQHWSLQRG